MDENLSKMIKDIYVVLENVEIKNTRANKLKKCDWCGKEFSTETNGKFCSDTCKKEKKNSFRSLKKCKNCGKTFFGFKH